MRRSLGKFPNPNIGKCTLLSSSSAFSTSAGGGAGRGRGRGSCTSDFPDSRFSPGRTEPEDPKDDSPFPSGLGHGHGRGKPLPSTPILPSFSSLMSGMTSTSTGRGRGGGTTPPQSESHPPEPQNSGPKKPIFFLKEDGPDLTPRTPISDRRRTPDESDLPSSILSVLSGAGRGKPARPSGADEKVKEENRHLRAPRQPGAGPGRGRGVDVGSGESSATPRLSREEAVKKAVGILSRGGAGDGVEEGGRGRGFRGRGGRGRGVQGWRGRGRGRGRGGRREGRQDTEEDDNGLGLYLGDDADGERLAKTIGAENMNNLVEEFEEMSGRVLPSPMDDAYLDALHTNYMVRHSNCD